nr:immunoglobulin heavy chain junction region [Mus musculus]
FCARRTAYEYYFDY